MRAELVLMGKRIDMAPRAHRRTLVVLIYCVLAVMLACLWALDRRHTFGIYMLFATLLMNRWFLGGYNFGGLIKPFNGKGPRRAVNSPQTLMIALRLYRLEPEESEYRNDECELHQRDRAHYQAYQAIIYILAIFWLLSGWWGNFLRFLAWMPLSANELLYGLALAAMVTAFTLPQAILLWTEPDMEESPVS
jgi:small-conductance mechanosensitive channel